MQRKLVRRLELEMLIASVPPHPSPKAALEQYTIPPEVATEMLHIAAYVNDDIIGKRVLDLGCGTGRLALGAAYLGADIVLGCDLDREAINLARKASIDLGLKDRTLWVTGDLNALHGCFDTVIQNPPFGVQRRGADRVFLRRALELGRKVYSLHKNVLMDRREMRRSGGYGTTVIPTNPSPFLKRLIESYGGVIKAVYAMPMIIPHTFKFHRRLRHRFIVDLYVVDVKKN